MGVDGVQTSIAVSETPSKRLRRIHEKEEEEGGKGKTRRASRRTSEEEGRTASCAVTDRMGSGWDRSVAALGGVAASIGSSSAGPMKG